MQGVIENGVDEESRKLTHCLFTAFAGAPRGQHAVGSVCLHSFNKSPEFSTHHFNQPFTIKQTPVSVEDSVRCHAERAQNVVRVLPPGTVELAVEINKGACMTHAVL